MYNSETGSEFVAPDAKMHCGAPDRCDDIKIPMLFVRRDVGLRLKELVQDASSALRVDLTCGAHIPPRPQGVCDRHPLPFMPHTTPCSNTQTSCVAVMSTRHQSCAAVCERSGLVCTRAWNDDGGTCILDTPLECKTAGWSNLVCTCAVPTSPTTNTSITTATTTTTTSATTTTSCWYGTLWPKPCVFLFF